MEIEKNSNTIYSYLTWSKLKAMNLIPWLLQTAMKESFLLKAFQDKSLSVCKPIYVAMTRAKSQLIMSTSDIPSSWLTNENIKLDTDQWDEL